MSGGQAVGFLLCLDGQEEGEPCLRLIQDCIPRREKKVLRESYVWEDFSKREWKEFFIATITSLLRSCVDKQQSAGATWPILNPSFEF